MTYTYHEEGGHSEDLDAENMADAVKMARALCRGGDWGTDGASVDVWITEEDEDGEEIDRRGITVEIEPDHSYLIPQACGGKWDARKERSCGNDPDDHDWTSDGEGGCTENPGVWSTGGTSMSFVSHCRACGLRRSEMTRGSQRNPGNPGDHDTTQYEMPESWCVECQSEECACETADAD